MPCRVDPPTNYERAQLSDAERTFEKVLDSMTHKADMVREIILSAGGQQKNLTADQALALGALLEGRSGLLAKFRDQVAAIDRLWLSPASGSTYHLKDKVLNEYLQATNVAERMVETGKKVGIAAIHKAQVKHRKEDIKRLIKHFADKKDFDMVAKLAQVDFEKPLEPQIGFDPDDF